MGWPVDYAIEQGFRRAHSTPAALSGADRLAEDIRQFSVERGVPDTADTYRGMIVALTYLHYVRTGMEEIGALPHDIADRLNEFSTAMADAVGILANREPVELTA